MTAPTADTTRVSVHANCTHLKTKAARAKCRRLHRGPQWVVIERSSAAAIKGANVRVTLVPDITGEQAQIRAVLLGWGNKRMIVRDTNGDRLTFTLDEVEVVEVPAE